MRNAIKKNNRNNIQVEFQRINTKDLFPHPIAQRDFDQNHGKWLEKNWDWGVYDPIDVSFRDGKYWIIDGQHRVYAIKENAGRDVTILCRVHYGMTLLDEAKFFINQDKGKKRIRTNDTLRVEYKTGDEEVTDAVNCVTIAGWNMDKFSKSYARNQLTAHATVMKLHKGLTREQFIDLLTVLHKAFDGEPKGACRQILNGMFRFYKTYWGEFDSGILTRSLSKVTPDYIIRDGNSAVLTVGANTSVPFARAILRQYNYRNKHQLQDRL